MHSVVERRPKVPTGVAPVTNTKRLRGWRGEATYIPLDLTGGPRQTTPGGLIAASVTYLSRREGVLPCLRTSPPLG